MNKKEKINTFSLRRVKAVVMRHMYSWPRDLNNLIDCFWWVSFDLIIWGLTSGYIQKNQQLAESSPFNILSFLIGGLILWTFIYRTQQEISIAFVRESWDRNMLNLFSSPLTILEHITASIIIGILKLTVSVVWVSILAYLMFAFNIFDVGFLLVPFVINLLIVGWWAAFIVNGLLVQYGQRVESFSWFIVYAIQPFSAVFYPVSGLPLWMQVVSRLLPTSYIFEGMRTVLSKNSIDPMNLLIAFGLNFVYLFFAIMFYRHSYKIALKTGMIMKLS